MKKRQKQNKTQEILSILGLISFTLIAILIKSNADKPVDPIKMTYDVPIESEMVAYGLPPLEENEPIHALNNEDILAIPLTTTFANAFAKARKELGPGGLFSWNGQVYTTSFAEEMTDVQIDLIDTTLVNIVMNQPNNEE